MSMTREEAIDYLEWIRPKKPYTQDKKNVQTAIDMAIEALKETERNPTITSWYDFDRGYEKGKADARPHGEWEWQTEDKYRCSACKANVRVEECMNEPQYDFCPKCGADMREGDEK